MTLKLTITDQASPQMKLVILQALKGDTGDVGPEGPEADPSATRVYTGGVGHFLKIDGSALPADSRDFNFGVSGGDNINLPGDTRGNVVMHMGWNMASNATREDATDACFGLSFEQHYLQAGVPPAAFEFHLQGVDTSGNAFRPMSFFIPKDGSVGVISSLTVNRFNINDQGGIQRVLFDFTNNAVSLNALTLNFNTNNVPALNQRNAANNAYLPLPYYNADNALALSASIRIVGPTPTTGIYPNTFAVFQATTLAANGRLLDLTGPAVTGSYYAAQFNGAATADFLLAIYNNTNNPNAKAVLELRTIGAAAGDPLIRFSINGATTWNVGIDNSDSDTFKWSNTGLGTSDRAWLTTGGHFGVAGSIAPASYTIATVPAAASFPRAVIYVSNEIGGATLAFSDGVNWRRLADRAVIS